jgi:hypothetical protein
MNQASSASAKAVIRTKAIITHGHVHLDEIASIWLLTTAGKNLFPGVEDAEIRFVTQSPRGDDGEYDMNGLVPVGCGGGRFDEHVTSGRRPGECSATLVAKHLGIENRPGVKEILAEVLACDTAGGTHNLQMAELVKTAHRCMPGGDKSTIKWAMTGLSWACHQIKMSYAPKNGHEPGAVSMLERWLERAKVDDKFSTFVRRLCNESVERKDNTGLDFVIRAMHRGGRSIDDIFEWVLSAFNWLKVDQEQFWQAVEEVRPGDPGEDGVARSKDGKTASSYLVPATVGDEKKRVKLLVVQSDNRRAHRAAMWLKPAVLILRHGNGQTQIFCHRQGGLDADIVADVAAHLRYWEGGKDANVSWEELRKPGNVSCSPGWYFFPEGLQVLNGSETHTGVPATKLPISSIVQAVRRALFLPDLRRWQKELGIEIPEHKPKARPLASVGEIADTHNHENGGGEETKGV